jgi:hypothetical protein
MFYKAKVAVCSEIRTKHINAMWAPWIIFECEAWWHVRLPLGFKGLITIKPCSPVGGYQSFGETTSTFVTRLYNNLYLHSGTAIDHEEDFNEDNQHSQ